MFSRPLCYSKRRVLLFFVVSSFFTLHGSFGNSAVYGATTSDNGPASKRTVVVDSPTTERFGWLAKRSQPPSPDHPITFYAELRTGKEGVVEQVALDVSDPLSPRYGKHLSRAELRALISAPAHVTERVVTWLREEAHPGEPIEWEDHADHILVKTTVRNVETLFDTTMATFEKRGFDSRVAITQSATMPNQVAQMVSRIYGLANFNPTFKFTAHRHEARNTPNTDPSLLRSLYNVSSSLQAQSSTLKQAVVAFNDYYDLNSLRAFETNFSLPKASVQNVGSPSCLPNCHETESDLDIQYITAMGAGVSTLFNANSNTQTIFIYDWATSVVEGKVPSANVYSISYGTADWLSQWLGEEARLAQLAALGITVIVSSGDTGAAGLYTFPAINTSLWCPLGGCNHTSTECAQFNYLQSGGEISSYPNSLSGYNYEPLSDFQAFATANAQCNLTYEQDREGNPNLYSSCACANLTYGVYGSTLFEQYEDNPIKYPIISPQYPATSAWVTTVGATDYIAGEEVTANFIASSFTSGGGFSRSIQQPSWQSAAVQGYLNKSVGSIPPPNYFNSTGRACPDISLLGTRFQIFTSSGPQLVGGTSASTPTFAGLVSLINYEREQLGLSTLGFLNPVLYNLAHSNPEVFGDITVGDNKGTETFVGLYGYPAIRGWDAATGLGTVNFGLLLEHLQNLTLPTPSPGPSVPPGYGGGSGNQLRSPLRIIASLWA